MWSKFITQKLTISHYVIDNNHKVKASILLLVNTVQVLVSKHFCSLIIEKEEEQEVWYGSGKGPRYSVQYIVEWWVILLA